MLSTEHRRRIRRITRLYSLLRVINSDIHDVAIYGRLGLKPKGMHFSDGKVKWPKRRTA